MSYSRWINSHWYTYYMVPDTCKRDEQYFEICGVRSFSYAALKKEINSCLQTVREMDEGATEDQIRELKGHMESFLYDVEKDGKECDYYEDLENLRYDKIREIKEWLINRGIKRDREEELEEGLRILSASEDEIPTLIGIPKTELGKIILEKRLKSPRHGGIA